MRFSAGIAVIGFVAGLAMTAAVTPASAVERADGDTAILSVVRHVQSGRCLDGSVSNGVRLLACNGGAYQEWGTRTGNDMVHIRSGRCLDASVSNGVRLHTCNGSTYQKWTN